MLDENKRLEATLESNSTLTNPRMTNGAKLNAHIGLGPSVNKSEVFDAVEEYLEKNPVSGGVNFTTDETLNLDPETKVLSVNTASEASADNTLPITAAAVATQIGNIEILLSRI